MAPSTAPYLYRKSLGTHDSEVAADLFIGDSLFPHHDCYTRSPPNDS
jgi:hypothetical protein